MSVLDLLTGSGVTAVLIAIVSAVVQRRKLSAETDKASADATSVLTAAATALVEPLERRIRELDSEVDELRGKVRQLNDDLDASHDRETRKDALIAALSRPTEGT